MNKKTKAEFLQDVVAMYREAGEEWPATAKHIAAWAIREGHWKPPAKNVIQLCASDIAAAMRQEYFTDPQGRRVRKKHAFPQSIELPEGNYEQMFLWIDVTDASHEEVEMAFQYGRKLIVGDCKQLKTDVDSYNENNTHGRLIEMSFNFGDDLEEAAQPTSYPGL